MFSLTSRERMLIVFAAVALLVGAGIKHWRDSEQARALAQASAPASATDMK